MAKTKQELEKEGWRLASITAGDHLKRTLEMYRELGIEVYLEAAKPEDCGGCTECFTSVNETIYRVYTKQQYTEENSATAEHSTLSSPADRGNLIC